jgi:mevalonate kinase
LVLSVLKISNVLSDNSFRTFHPFMVLAIGMSLATAAAVKGYLEKIVLSEQSKQYERMVELYSLAAEKLTEALSKEDFEEARKLMLELGKEALIENGDWLLLHRAQQLEVPILEAKPRMP